jgi:hypothetical protein
LFSTPRRVAPRPSRLPPRATVCLSQFRPPDDSQQSAEVLGGLRVGFDADALDDPIDAIYRGEFEWNENQNFKEYIPISVERGGEKRDWNMEEIMFFLNNIGDNWESRRAARRDEHQSGEYRTTFVRTSGGGGAKSDLRVFRYRRFISANLPRLEMSACMAGMNAKPAGA